MGFFTHPIVAAAFALSASAQSFAVGEPGSGCPAEQDPFAAVAGLTCHVEKMGQECRDWFAQSPGTAAFSRDCQADDRRGADLDVARTCASAIGGAWASAWTSLAGRYAANEKFYDDCEADASLACKKRLALESHWAYADDAALAEVDTMALVRKRESVREMAKTDKAYRDELIAAGVPLPSPGGGLPDVPVLALLALGTRELERLGVRWRCYNAAGYAKLVCSAVGSLVDPTVLLAGAGAALRGGRFAAAALKGLAEARDVDVAASSLGRAGASAVKEAVRLGEAGPATMPAAAVASERQEALKALWDLNPNYEAIRFGDNPAVLRRLIEMHVQSGEAIQGDLDEIIRMGGAKKLIRLLTEDLERGEGLSASERNVETLHGLLMSANMNEKLKVAANMQDVTVIVVRETGWDSMHPLEVLARAGGDEIRESIVLLARSGHYDDIVRFAAAYREKGNGGLAEIRAGLATIRTQISEASLSKDGHRARPTKAVREERKIDALHPASERALHASAADVAELRARYPGVEQNIDDSVKRLQALKLLKTVKAVGKLPISEAMRARLSEVDPRAQEAIKNVWNRMNDPTAFAIYARTLAEDAGVEMLRNGSLRDRDALMRGDLSRNAVLKVLVKRHTLNGNSNFSTIVSGRDKPFEATRTRKTGSNADFRKAVGQGPFFDKPFTGLRHGTDTHFLQIDYVADVVAASTNGAPEVFWELLGSRSGILYWVMLFDNRGKDMFGTPEYLSHQVSGLLKIAD